MHLHALTSTAVTAADRGHELGAAHASEIRGTAAAYLQFIQSAGLPNAKIRSFAEGSFEALASWRPALAEELAATAMAAGLTAWEISVVNARTELLSAAGAARHECSTIAIAPEHGPGWSLQTWDWHPDLVAHGLAWTLRADSGRLVTTFTEFGAQGKIGVNDAGIGVHFNILSHRDDGNATGVPVHSIARAILDEATTIDDARSIIRSATLSASTAFTVTSSGVGEGDRQARAVSFEASPSGVGEVLPDVDGHIARTNHFLSAPLNMGETTPFAESKTIDRLAQLTSTAGAAEAVQGGPAERAAALYDDGAGAVLCFVPDPAAVPADRWETLVTVGIDGATGSLDISTDPPGAAGSMTFTRF